MQNIMEQSIKLFVPLGTQKFPFNRLVSALNQLIEDGSYTKDEIYMQSSICDVKPLFQNEGMMDVDSFNQMIDKSDVIITHSGVNTIMTCMQKKKAIIVVPRMKMYGEHVDDHQIEIANMLESKFNVLVLKDMSQLKSTIEEAKNHTYKVWESKRDLLIQAIKSIL